MRYHLDLWSRSSPSGVPPDLSIDVNIPGDESDIRERSATANRVLAHMMLRCNLSQAAKVVFAYYASSSGECLGGKVLQNAVLLPSDPPQVRCRL